MAFLTGEFTLSNTRCSAPAEQGCIGPNGDMVPAHERVRGGDGKTTSPSPSQRASASSHERAQRPISKLEAVSNFGIQKSGMGWASSDWLARAKAGGGRWERSSLGLQTCRATGQ